MNERFEVGEIAIVHQPGRATHGRECTVTGPLKVRTFLDNGRERTAACYRIDVQGLTPPSHWRSYVAEPHELRKKRPPLKTWADVMADTNWHPKLTRSTA